MPPFLMRLTEVRQAFFASAFIAILGMQSTICAQTPSPPNSQPEFDVTAAGIMSMQTASDYVGGPYLDKGLSGFVVGYLLGTKLVAVKGLTIATELSDALQLQVAQSGRLLGGNNATGTGRLRDRLWSLLGGRTSSWGSKSRVAILAGVSLGAGTPTVNGIPIDQPFQGRVDPAAIEEYRRIAFTAGLDFGRMLSPRGRFVAGVRVFNVGRSRRAAEVGVGDLLMRFSAGYEWRMTK